MATIVIFVGLTIINLILGGSKVYDIMNGITPSLLECGCMTFCIFAAGATFGVVLHEILPCGRESK